MLIHGRSTPCTIAPPALCPFCFLTSCFTMLVSLARPPSTATVIGIQSDGDSLLEERKGGDSQKSSSGQIDSCHMTLLSPLLSFPWLRKALHSLSAIISFIPRENKRRAFVRMGHGVGDQG